MFDVVFVKWKQVLLPGRWGNLNPSLNFVYGLALIDSIGAKITLGYLAQKTLNTDWPTCIAN